MAALEECMELVENRISAQPMLQRRGLIREVQQIDQDNNEHPYLEPEGQLVVSNLDDQQYYDEEEDGRYELSLSNVGHNNNQHSH